MSSAAPEVAPHAVFAALGDPTRMAILALLAHGERLPLSGLAQASRLTRQGVTKHLTVLEKAGLVSSRRSGRERRFTLEPDAVNRATAYLDAVSRQWDCAIGRLRRHVEESAETPQASFTP